MAKKKYKIVPTKRQLDLMRQAWEEFRKEEEKFFKEVSFIEDLLAEETGIDDIEFFACDGNYVGVGNTSRTMKLIQWDKLENKNGKK